MRTLIAATTLALTVLGSAHAEAALSLSKAKHLVAQATRKWDPKRPNSSRVQQIDGYKVVLGRFGYNRIERGGTIYEIHGDPRATRRQGLWIETKRGGE